MWDKMFFYHAGALKESGTPAGRRLLSSEGQYRPLFVAERQRETMDRCFLESVTGKAVAKFFQQYRPFGALHQNPRPSRGEERAGRPHEARNVGEPPGDRLLHDREGLVMQLLDAALDHVRFGETDLPNRVPQKICAFSPRFQQIKWFVGTREFDWNAGKTRTAANIQECARRAQQRDHRKGINEVQPYDTLVVTDGREIEPGAPGGEDRKVTGKRSDLTT